MLRRVFALVICCAGSVLAQNIDWRFSHPDAKAFVGFKLRHLKDSEIGKTLHSEFQAQDFPDLSAIPGTELLDQIDEIVVSSPGRREGMPESAQPPVLIRVTGDFDASHIESILVRTGAKMQKYRAFRVFRHKTDGDMAAVVIDSHTLLLGDADSLFGALERMEWSDTPKNPLLARASEMQATYDVWALFAVTPSSFTSAQVPQLAALNALRGVEVGVSVVDGLVLRLSLNTDSPKEAARMAAQLKTLLTGALLQGGALPEAATIAKNIGFEVEQNSIRLQVKVSAEQVRKVLAEGRRVRAQKQAEIAAVPRPDPPGPKVIRIEGLDDGPREIPYK